MPYRLYLDESGDHASSHAHEIGKRYLGLVGVTLDQDGGYRDFVQCLDALRRQHFGEDPPVLHREDIVARSGEFAVLRDAEKRLAFDTGLLKTIEQADCWIVAVVIDKHEHGTTRYRDLGHPYHCALHVMIERYCGYLKLLGKTGDIMAESRGGKEDMALKGVYREVYEKGTRYLRREDCGLTLSSCEIKIKPKHNGVHGLQLADLLAHPLTRDVLVAYNRIGDHGSEFSCKIAKIAESKYNRQTCNGRIKGYGQILLA